MKLNGGGGYIKVTDDAIILFIIIIILFLNVSLSYFVMICVFCFTCPHRHVLVHPVILISYNNILQQ